MDVHHLRDSIFNFVLSRIHAAINRRPYFLIKKKRPEGRFECFHNGPKTLL